MSIRIPVTLVIEMDDEQEADYRETYGLPEPPRAKDVVEDVRKYVLSCIQDSAAFSEFGNGTSGATVTIKER